MHKKILYTALTIILFLNIGCKQKENITPQGNSVYQLKNMVLSGFGSAEYLLGNTQFKIYTQVDTSTVWKVSEFTQEYRIYNANGHNQEFSLDLSDKTKKVEISTTFQVIGSTADQFSIDSISFQYNGETKYLKTDYSNSLRSSYYVLEDIVIEL